MTNEAADVALRVAICEDDDGDAVRLADMIRASGEGRVTYKIARFSSCEEFLNSKPEGRFQVIFMDIYMEGLSGMDAARALRESDKDVAIVFTTSSEDHALDAFRVEAKQYLVKPFTGEHVEDVLREIALRTAEREEKNSTLEVVVDRRVKNIPTKDILYAEANGKHCRIMTTGGGCTVYTTIDAIGRQLSAENFIRCHRSFIANMAWVKSIDMDFAMKNGDIVHIGKRRYPKIRSEYANWLFRKAWEEQ